MSVIIWGGVFFAYVLAGRLLIRQLRGVWRDGLFALMNIAGLYFFWMKGLGFVSHLDFLIYVLLVLVQFAMLYAFAEKPGGLPWLAFFTPIAMLVLVRYFPSAFSATGHFLFPQRVSTTTVISLIGISYLAFRNSLLVLEIRNGKVKRPSLWRFLGYSFFVPTIPVGPINPYSNYCRAFEASQPEIPIGRAALRVIVGLVKYQFLGSLCNRLTYDGLLLDDHLHHWLDLPVAMVFYYLYLYCNFSGFCDMAIGAAGLMGIPVAENFDNPLVARNMREFWNRWHITLSGWMRDVVFAPLSKFLVRVMGGGNTNHAIALTIFVVFLLIGIWHGVGWNYALFGLAQAVGVVTVHYYTIFLKKRLGRDGFKAYNDSPWIHAVAVVITFCYYAATLFLFANTVDEMKQIFSLLRW
ncbi:MAG TPA: MBOAT family O-acyltransferase [Candidatus Sulfotelmatobacter sp.]|jgi:D-alanyl-lipoteichoic acid acyltransferase DltB (MBOAT superfamily)|nr:MBOAT family O-acyltransferase [Candidatus Sulfotelmatobacter sp.]